MKPMNKIAAIHDISCYGRAALATIIPILSSMGNQVCPLPTAVLSTHTDGFGKPAIRDLSDFIYETKDHWKRLNLNFQCIYSGYLADPNQVKFVEKFIEEFKEDDTLFIDAYFLNTTENTTFENLENFNISVYDTNNKEVLNKTFKSVVIPKGLPPQHGRRILFPIENEFFNLQEKDLSKLSYKFTFDYN